MTMDLIPIVSVIIITWNNEGTIIPSLESVILQQNIKNLEIIVVDNASSDDTVKLIRSFNEVKLTVNKDNIGFCAAINLGIKKSKGKYILLLNPDSILTEEYLSVLIPYIENYPRIALLTGKILLLYKNGKPVLKNGRNIIDTVGITMRRNRQAEDIGSGEIDNQQYEYACDVFGVSGAVCLCRSEALQDVMVDGQVLDQTFFAYKEDVDLSWRLRKRGWICAYTPQAIAYHARSWSPYFKKRDEVSPEIRFHSFKNRRLMILKNDSLKCILADLLPILSFEIKSFIYVLFKEPFLFRAYWEICKYLPHIIYWRKELSKN